MWPKALETVGRRNRGGYRYGKRLIGVSAPHGTRRFGIRASWQEPNRGRSHARRTSISSVNRQAHGADFACARQGHGTAFESFRQGSWGRCLGAVQAGSLRSSRRRPWIAPVGWRLWQHLRGDGAPSRLDGVVGTAATRGPAAITGTYCPLTSSPPTQPTWPRGPVRRDRRTTRLESIGSIGESACFQDDELELRAVPGGPAVAHVSTSIQE